MASPGHLILILAALYFSSCTAGPLPNVTSVDMGLKEGSCALGDVVYMPGDQFPGTSPCESCKCSDGYVDCTRQTCEPRPGCKALHRPDHCCPTYQCECEQEGRIYGNGEKLVDPLDPCRVCYCQGGEVVCRRIACFVRDDCQPRLVPGRCCPEYDNCPVRDGTPLPGMVSSAPSLPVYDNVETSAIPSPPSEPIKPEITIKEITPVSEIPVITDVKIKEILPSPSIEVSEYSSSKSPLITREATTERNLSNMDKVSKVDTFDSKDGLSSSITPELPTNEQSSEIKTTNDMPPSKITLSTDDSVNDDMIPSKIPNIVSMMGAPSISDSGTSTTKAPILEEEDLDHNPAFPPIPDDLFLVLSNHDEEIISDQSLDNEHVPMDHEIVKVANVPVSTQEPIFKESLATTISYISDIVTITSDNIQDNSAETSTYKDATVSTQFPITKENSMLNMRSVIPTEILNVPSLISDDITGDMLDVTQSSITAVVNDESSPTENSAADISTKYTNNELQDKGEESYTNVSFNETQTSKMDETTNTLSKSTEIISETEFSSIPIETSDQNPHDVAEKENKDKLSASTVNLVMTESSTIKSLFNDEDAVTVSKSSEKEDQPFENSETTEFYLTSFDSQESSTDIVELIKASSNNEKSSAIIESSRKKNSNVLTDLINLVGDVASISDHAEGQDPERQQTPSPTTISDSEELIPVNVAAGYKSKNKNWNLNSITEVPLKHKVPMMVSKQNVVEIESDDSDAITDSPPPNDKVEPTTRRPIIDNVSDTDNKTEIADKKDIEIITQSYVPTINRRPNKVVMKKSNEKPISEESLSDVGVTTPEATVEAISSSSELTNIPDLNTSSTKDVTSTSEVDVSASSDVKNSPDAIESTSELEDVSSLPEKEQSTESSSTTTQ
ncbi:probable GPI-anchored adhesin-like protein PGA55 isoform X2 [Vanessa cardui]|nr:probable GPI-anchored adhesin-like protein PGA55 isoform X2 [Vanessa cardui]